jgi:hypothetical protein
MQPIFVSGSAQCHCGQTVTILAQTSGGEDFYRMCACGEPWVRLCSRPYTRDDQLGITVRMRMQYRRDPDATGYEER